MAKGKKSFFVELLFDFALILSIPLSTVLLILWLSNNIVKEQVLDIESKSLHLDVERMEKVMGEIKEICHTLYSSDDCKMYATVSDIRNTWAFDLRTRVANTIQSLSKSDIYDIFIYYYNGRIISNKYGILNASDYYATFYTKRVLDGELQATFFNMLKSDYKKPMCHIIHDGEGNSYLCMTMRANNKKSYNFNFTICVVMSSTNLRQQSVNQVGDKDNVFQVYNAEKKLVFSNNLVLEQEFAQISEILECTAYNTWIDRGDYVMQVIQSEELENYYVYAVPKSLFWKTLRWLRACGFIGIGLCVLVSIYIAYKRAKREYEPLKNIMEHLNIEYGKEFSGEATSEFLHIKSYVDNQEKLIREKNIISTQWFLYGLLMGKSNEVNKNVLEENNIFFKSERFVVCIVQIEALNPEKEYLSSFTVRNIVGELCDFLGKSYFVELSSKRCALLVNLYDEKMDLYGVLQCGQEILREKAGIILSVGYSNVHEGIKAIPEAYMEAQEAIRYRFLEGSGKLISYGDIKNRSAYYRNNEGSKVYMLLLDYIESKKEEEDLGVFVEQLMSLYQMNEELSMDVATVFKNEIVSALEKIEEFFGYTEEEIKLVQKSIKKVDTLSEFRQILSYQIAELCKRKVKRSGKDDVLEKLKYLIHEKYMDGDLSVGMLGEDIGMHPTNVSKNFKNKYGINLSDYIASVRISHAKDLLQEEKLSVQEIGEKVGFLSTSVFVRTFKKKEKITPGQYREMVKKDN